MHIGMRQPPSITSQIVFDRIDNYMESYDDFIKFLLCAIAKRKEATNRIDTILEEVTEETTFT